MPFLWLSSSSSVIMGRYTSCSSKRNSDVGSCISTLVSSTNSLVAPVWSAWRLVDDLSGTSTGLCLAGWGALALIGVTLLRAAGAAVALAGASAFAVAAVAGAAAFSTAGAALSTAA